MFNGVPQSKGEMTIHAGYSAVTIGGQGDPGPPKKLNLENFFPKGLYIIVSSVQYKNFLWRRCQRGLFQPF